MPAPKALIISNLPILARSVAHAFRDKYDVMAQTWPHSEELPSFGVELIVLDVTLQGREAAHQLLAHMPPGTRAAICSLHRNEVDLYWIGDDGPAPEGELPSLLSLPAPRPRADAPSFPAQQV